MRRALLVPAALLALAGCQDAPPPPAGRPAPPPATTASLAPVTASLAIRDGAGAAGPFRIGDLAHLAVEASCRSGLPGRHPVRIDVVAPGGALYAQLHGSLDVGADGAGVSSHAIEVQGTPIETFHQVGRWRFALTVDGAPLATAEVDLTE